MTEPAPDGWVRLPPDLLVPTLKSEFLASFADLRVRVEPNGSWLIRTSEADRRASPPSITLTLLARGTEFEASGLKRLSALPPITQSTPAEELRAMRDARRSQVKRRGEPEPLWVRFAGEVQVADDPDLVPILRSVQEEGSPGDSLWLASAEPVLSHRLAMMRALFAQAHTHEVIQQEPFEGFPAAKALMANSTAGFSLFFQPPLLYGSPWLIGGAAMRLHSTVLRLLTTPELGKQMAWSDQLDSFHLGMYSGRAWPQPPREPMESMPDREALLVWWAARISRLVHRLGDLALFRDEVGGYDAAGHLGTVLTVERLFVSAVEIMRLRTKDDFLRKVLIFDVLDLLDGQGLGNHEKNLDHTKEVQRWFDLRAALPLPVVRCLSPVVDGAFEALHAVADGFWLPSRRTADSRLLIDKKAGPGQEAIGIDRARGEYLRILRNSHHGFRNIVKNPRDLAYLASHDGGLDDRLPDLVWWYLVRLLANPEVLIRGHR